MNPKACPICAGRGSVPAAFYNAELPPDWEPGDLAPMISDGSEPVEAECQSCDGLGVIWPPGTTEEVSYLQGDSIWSYDIPSGGKVSVSGLFGWDDHTSEKVSLALVTDEDED
jgi:hypothetical protein